MSCADVTWRAVIASGWTLSNDCLIHHSTRVEQMIKNTKKNNSVRERASSNGTVEVPAYTPTHHQSLSGIVLLEWTIKVPRKCEPHHLAHGLLAHYGRQRWKEKRMKRAGCRLTVDVAGRLNRIETMKNNHRRNAALNLSGAFTLLLRLMRPMPST